MNGGKRKCKKWWTIKGCIKDILWIKKGSARKFVWLKWSESCWEYEWWIYVKSEKKNSENDWQLRVGLVFYREKRKTMEGCMRGVKEKVKKWKYGM